MWNRLIPLLTLLLTPVGPAWSQETQTPEDPKGLRPAILDSGRRSMAAERMREDERIVLDGVLDEPVWQRTVPASDFIQQDPVRIPDDREHRFQSNVNTDSGHVEQRFQDGEHGFRGT